MGKGNRGNGDVGREENHVPEGICFADPQKVTRGDV